MELIIGLGAGVALLYLIRVLYYASVLMRPQVEQARHERRVEREWQHLQKRQHRIREEADYQRRKEANELLCQRIIERWGAAVWCIAVLGGTIAVGIRFFG